MNSNSLAVYVEKVLPTLSQRQTDVINSITNLNKCTIYQAARYLGVFPNQISGRFGELVKKGAIKIVGKIHQDNRPHSIYTLNV